VNERGTPDFVRDRDGSVVQSHLDETTLTEIAQATHGTYQPLGQLGEGLNRVRHFVESSSNSSDAAKARKLGVDRFYVPLAGVVVLIVLESLIGTRRKSRQNVS
jgi:Ca-activated chloride channel homolog